MYIYICVCVYIYRLYTIFLLLYIVYRLRSEASVASSLSHRMLGPSRNLLALKGEQTAAVPGA